MDDVVRLAEVGVKKMRFEESHDTDNDEHDPDHGCDCLCHNWLLCLAKSYSANARALRVPSVTWPMAPTRLAVRLLPLTSKTGSNGWDEKNARPDIR
jgi:hypothetical protein